MNPTPSLRTQRRQAIQERILRNRNQLGQPEATLADSSQKQDLT